MKNKIEKVIKNVQESNTISEENKEAIVEKLDGWSEEENAANEVAIYFEEWWEEIEPFFAELGWVQQVELYTQYTYEKKWTKTSKKDALHMISEEMPETDEEGTLAYIMREIQKGKTITLGECRFKTNKD